MIISFRHNFIFVAIPKTATHAFRHALRPCLAPNDWEQCVLFERKFFPIAALAEIGHGHLSLRQIEPFVLPQMFENFFKFCTVRNPFDRFVSYCRFINRDTQNMQTGALATMKKTIADKSIQRQPLFRPQIEFVTDEAENLLVDFVCRFENLQSDFEKVCEKLGFPAVRLEKVNSTDATNYQSFYDNELKEMTREFYRKDFEFFDYPLDFTKTDE